MIWLIESNCFPGNSTRNMHIPFYAQADAVNNDHQFSSELMAADARPPNTGYVLENGDVGLSARTSDSLMRS